MPHLYCYSKKHKHFDVSRYRGGRKFVVNSVKLALIESLSLHHMQCYILSKIIWKSVKWTEVVILHEAIHCLFADLFPL